MEKIFFEIDSEDFVVHLVKDEHWKEGEVYPIMRASNSDEWSYKSNDDGCPIDTTEGATCLFDFMFCWRGIWEGRVYFKDDEYWCEQLATISELWDAIEVKMKDRIRTQNPENKYDQ